MLMTMLSLAGTTVTRIQENISCRVLSLHLLRPDQRPPRRRPTCGERSYFGSLLQLLRLTKL